MRSLLRLLSPVPLTTMTAGGLLFLAFWLSRRFGLAMPWMMMIMLGIGFIYALALILLRMRAARAGSQLEQSLKAQAEKQAHGARPGREQEIEALKTRLLEAIQALKTSRAGKASGGSRALYVLPWYMIIGPPAAGKTTLLENSGLNFPYQDQNRKRASVRGIGGTRNCDWWFAEEAVIIDTAGRYVLPVEAEDTDEWLGFLDLMREHRGQKPINGLIVGISIADLISGSEDDVDEHATRIRGRIDELIQRLGIAFPVYVIFTKCDLIRGFIEFFGDLSRAERAQVLGMTVSRERSEQELSDQIFGVEFDRISTALRQARTGRVARIEQVETRPGAFIFPLQFDAVRPRLSRFLGALFRANPYQEAPIFRGFYFTSGTQEGRPIDQVINAMLRGFGGGEASEGLVVEPSQAKSYFIENAFSKIMFRDRNLAGPSAAGERLRHRRRVRAFATACFGLALFSAVLFGFSASNHSLITDVRNLCDQVQSATLGAGGRLHLGDLAALDELRVKLEKMEGRSGAAARLASLGTYQGDRVLQEARRLHFAVLRTAAVQPAIQDLLRELRDDPGGDFFGLYDRYDTWRILQDPAVRLQTESEAERAARVLGRHWALVSADGSVEEYQELLMRQLEYLTRHPRLRGDIFPPTQLENPLLENEIRSRLTHSWTLSGLLPALQACGTAEPDITVEALVGPGSALRGEHEIPGTYSMVGWKGPVRAFLQRVEDARSTETLRSAYGYSVPPDLSDSLLSRYVAIYVQHWVDFLGGVQVAGPRNPETTQTFLERAADVNSPVLQLLRGVAENTSFVDAGDPRLRPIEDAFGLAHELFQEPGRGVFRWVRGKIDPEKAPYQEYLDLVTALKEGYAAIADSPNPSRAKEALDIGTWIDVHLPVEAPPEQGITRLLRFPTTVMTRTVRTARGAAIQAQWVSVYNEFSEKLAGRYPCAARGPDVSLTDFESFFSPAGSFWAFYNANLPSVISEDGRQVLDTGVPLSPAFKNALHQAYRIRGSLFRSGDRAGFVLSLLPGNPRRDPATGIISRETRLEVGGESLVWQIGVQTWREVSWPGANSAAGARLSFTASNASATPLEAEGVWGLFRLMETAQIGPVSGEQGSIEWTLETDRGEVQIPYEVRGLPAVHPLRKGLLRFECPADIRGGR